MQNEVLQLQSLVDEWERIRDLPDTTIIEVDEYLGEQMVAIDNLIDEVCQKINYMKLLPN